MNFHRYPFLTIFILISLQNGIFSSPVLIWSNVNLPKLTVPLSGLTPENLISNYICPMTNSKFEVRLFAVENLEIEDLDEPYAFLSYAKTDNSKVRYFPDVTSDPYATFSSLATLNINQCSHISFTVLQKNTFEQLEHALNTIQGSIDNVEADGTKDVLIVLLNADSTRTSRHRRAVKIDSRQVIVSNDKTCMFYAESLNWITENDAGKTNRLYNLALSNSTCLVGQINGTTGLTNTSSVELFWIGSNTTSPDSVSVRIVVTMHGTSWFLSTVTLNNITYRYFAYGTNSLMKTPWYFSYACGQSYFVRYSDSAPNGFYNFSDIFYINSFQFQPFGGNGLQFGQVNYCTSFFTSGIWMGITTSFLLLGILLFGVHRMMSIKANDRFDDPKGKPLLIKAQE